MNLLEALQWANAKFKKAGVDSPMLDAEILLASILELSRARLFAHGADTLRSHQMEAYHLLIERRAKREPLAFILERKAFFGRTFFVNSSVLIPRPETECLVEETLQIVTASDANRTLITDIGTGSGAIAITLALETHLPVFATDVSEQSLSIAQKNAASLAPEESIAFRLGNLLEPLIALFQTMQSRSPFSYLVLVANLPYLTAKQWTKTEPEIYLYEPETALVSGADGLDHYSELFKQLQKHRDIFPTDITLLLEIDPDQEKKMEQMIFHLFPSAAMRFAYDLAKQKRVVIIHL